MLLSSWLRRLRSTLAPGESQRHHPRRGCLRAATRRLNVEVLEDRALPSLNYAGSFPVGNLPQAVVTADFNNDGHLDLATANYYDGDVSVLLGDGGGGFGNVNNFVAGTNPVSLAVGDFNNDGHLDLATANKGSNDLSMLLGNGDGTFRAPVQIPTLPGPKAVAAADFNADGHLDLVYLGSSVEVLLGDGQGGFAIRQEYSVSGRRLAVADLNADGRPDVVTTGGGFDGVVRVLLGNEDGTLHYVGAFATGGVPESVAVGDFTGDGVPDLATIGTAPYYMNHALDLLPGLGDGTFAAPINNISPIGLYLSAADFNGDGNLDLLATDDTYWSEYASLLLGRGDGTFESPDFLDASGPTTVGDFNEDGYPDLVAAEDFDPDSQVSVFLNDGDWSVPPPSIAIHDSTVTEGNAGTVAATFTVTLSAASTEAITVIYATGNGTATAGSDYQAASGMLTFAPGETSKTITVLVNGDRLAESNETFNVNLSGATNAVIGDGQGMGSIVDDEPRISISDVTRYEGRKNKTTLFTFTVTLSTAYDQPVSVSFQTVNGTATTSDNDYTAKTGTLTFAPGETTKTITIEVKGDSKKEADETFYLDVYGNSSNSLFTKSRGIGTILNDD
jgi:Calx-beta domain-containing protein/VCBS repeat protein